VKPPPPPRSSVPKPCPPPRPSAEDKDKRMEKMGRNIFDPERAPKKIVLEQYRTSPSFKAEETVMRNIKKKMEGQFWEHEYHEI
jgi:hypothetical protein